MIEVVQYETEDGACPFADWFEILDARAAAKVRTAIARIETGNLGDAKSVGEGVTERRINFGPGYRVYFGQDGRQLVVLLVGGTKKRQQRDIAQCPVSPYFSLSARREVASREARERRNSYPYCKLAQRSGWSLLVASEGSPPTAPRPGVA